METEVTGISPSREVPSSGKKKKNRVRAEVGKIRSSEALPQKFSSVTL
jgi:hypothetical protein